MELAYLACRALGEPAKEGLVIRVVLAALATLVALWAIGFTTIAITACTEPGTCSRPGEVARDHGGTLTLGGVAAVLLGGTLLHLTRRKVGR